MIDRLPAPKNIVYFDLETQKSADEVGGWNNIRDMRMSVGVTYSTARGDYKIYAEKQVNDLINELMRADLVVGFNNLRFDYEVLHGYTVFDLRQVPTLDMLIELQKIINHRLSLDSIATTTLGVEKTAEGLQAIEWFRKGRLMEIAGKNHVVRKHDFIFLPPGVEHAISNSGLVDLVFLVITSPVTDGGKVL